mmetsp:Transcript_16975/g.38622  ORF Transcript_16975/g.38622 Transcript_16975/m.38622 type:complete len:385 (-) Transcript_16975:1670-2824(-)
MPRPRASPENLSLALELSRVLTTRDGTTEENFVARHGSASLFSALARCVPPVVRTSNASSSDRTAISEAEMLRMLETQDNKEEFVRFRNRKGLRKSEDPTGAGVSMFIGRRWRDPDDAADCEVLEDGHARLQASFPVYAAHCSLARLFEVVRSIRHSWNLLCIELDAREASRSPSHKEADPVKADLFNGAETFPVAPVAFPQASMECGKRFRDEFEHSVGALCMTHSEYPPVYHTVGSVQLNQHLRNVSESPPSAHYFQPVQLPSEPYAIHNSWCCKRQRQDEGWSSQPAHRDFMAHQVPVSSHSEALGTFCVLDPVGATLIVRDGACRSSAGDERNFQLSVDSQAMWMDLHAKSVFDDFDVVRKSDDWYGWNRPAHCVQTVHT